MSGLGSRNNTGKLPYELIPPHTMTALASVLQVGAQKYSPRNWEKGMPHSTSYASLMRHLLAWWQGQETDPETNLPHSWHVLWNAMAIVEMERRLGEGDRRLSQLEIDNRPYVIVKDEKKKVSDKTFSINYGTIDAGAEELGYPSHGYHHWLGDYN